MNLCQFLQSSTTCPVCDEPLVTYLQEIDGDLWKAQTVEPNLYRFDRVKLKLDEHRDDQRNKNVGEISVRSPEDFIWIKDKGDDFEMGFNGLALEEFMRLQEVFFFNMCGAAIKERFSGNYIIEAYKACYYRSSALMNLQLVGEEGQLDWKLMRSSITEQPNIDIRDEIFTFKHYRDDNSEKVYILNLDYETDKTLFRYYTFTLDESKAADFEPDYFEKDLPPLSIRPNFKIEDRAKLIDRMNGWILMS